MGEEASALRVHRRSAWLDGAGWTALCLRPDSEFNVDIVTDTAPDHTASDDTVADATGSTPDGPAGLNQVDEVASTGEPRAGRAVRLRCDPGSGRTLARLCWVMAHQHHERTVVLLPSTGGQLVVVSNAETGALSDELISSLVGSVLLTAPSEGTVKLVTRGLDRATADVDGFWAAEAIEGHEHRTLRRRRWLRPHDGAVVLDASADVLRHWAVVVSEACAGRIDQQAWRTPELEIVGAIEVSPATTSP